LQNKSNAVAPHKRNGITFIFSLVLLSFAKLGIDEEQTCVAGFFKFVDY
jgi:hypothetical protein